MHLVRAAALAALGWILFGPSQLPPGLRVRGAETGGEYQGDDWSAPNTARAQARRRSRLRRRRGPAITPAYRRMRARWHERAPAGVRRRWEAELPPPLVLAPVHQRRRFRAVPDEEGRFDTEAMAQIQKALAYRGDGSNVPIHPRLAELVYRAVRRFDAPYVHVISGYRPARATSRHAQGRAIDLVLPGVPDRRLAAFLRQQGFVGVGVYPLSGFVHVDVRARSFYWVDRSGPGQAQRLRPSRRSEIARNDARAARRGEEPVPDLVLDGEVAGALPAESPALSVASGASGATEALDE